MGNGSACRKCERGDAGIVRDPLVCSPTGVIRELFMGDVQRAVSRRYPPKRKPHAAWAWAPNAGITTP